MKKKIFGIFTTIFLLVFFSKSIVYASESEYYVNKNGLEISTNEFKNLLSLGFSESQIYDMDEEEFEKNKNLSGKLVAIDERYVKSTYIYKSNDNSTNSINNNSNDKTLIKVINKEISEEEYNSIPEDVETVYMTNDVNPDIVETTYKKLTTTITHLSNGRYRFKNDLVWKKMPANRSYDVFVIGTNNAVSEPFNGTEYSKTSYSVKDSCLLTTTNYSTVHNSNWKKSSNGYGVSFKLPANTTKTYSWNGFQGTSYPCKDNPVLPPLHGSIAANLDVTALSSYMYYEVSKVGNSTTLSAFGTYQHSVKTINLNTSLNFGIDLNGNIGGTISMQPSISENFDGMEGTHAQISNPTW